MFRSYRSLGVTGVTDDSFSWSFSAAGLTSATTGTPETPVTPQQAELAKVELFIYGTTEPIHQAVSRTEEGKENYVRPRLLQQWTVRNSEPHTAGLSECNGHCARPAHPPAGGTRPAA